LAHCTAGNRLWRGGHRELSPTGPGAEGAAFHSAWNWRSAKKRADGEPGRADAGSPDGRLATQEAGRKTVLNLAAPDAPTLREICEAFSRRCGFPAAPAAPVWLLRGAARVGDIVQGLGWPVPLTTDTLKKLTTSTVLDVTRMQHTFSDLIWPDFEEELSRAAHYYAAD
jgi:hypothetical protein